MATDPRRYENSPCATDPTVVDCSLKPEESNFQTETPPADLEDIILEYSNTALAMSDVHEVTNNKSDTFRAQRQPSAHKVGLLSEPDDNATEDDLTSFAGTSSTLPPADLPTVKPEMIASLEKEDSDLMAAAIEILGIVLEDRNADLTSELLATLTEEVLKESDPELKALLMKYLNIVTLVAENNEIEGNSLIPALNTEDGEKESEMTDTVDNVPRLAIDKTTGGISEANVINNPAVMRKVDDAALSEPLEELNFEITKSGISLSSENEVQDMKNSDEVDVIELVSGVGAFEGSEMTDTVDKDLRLEIDKASGWISEANTNNPAEMRKVGDPASSEPSEEFDLEMIKSSSGISFFSANDESHEINVPGPLVVHFEKPTETNLPSSLNTANNQNANDDADNNAKNTDEVDIIALQSGVGSFEGSEITDTVDDDLRLEIDKATGWISEANANNPAVVRKVGDPVLSEPSEEFNLDIMKSSVAISFGDANDPNNEGHERKEPDPVAVHVQDPLENKMIPTFNHGNTVDGYETLHTRKENTLLDAIIDRNGVVSSEVDVDNMDEMEGNVEKTSNAISISNAPAGMVEVANSPIAEKSEGFDLEFIKATYGLDSESSKISGLDDSHNDDQSITSRVENNGAGSGRAVKGFRSPHLTGMIEIRVPASYAK
ncbi:hypothetical protein GHT06_015317 [Daphnia sinensis]|uniref:Uncharacterized protein n=1 Tax=Daphnia sinensis TaxID=1820382 RepID=A0AAD5KQY7_9CRUS|nr:hypothetical protein GHT06_015317 [Daphnia sinensis]